MLQRINILQDLVNKIFENASKNPTIILKTEWTRVNYAANISNLL